MSLFGQDDFAVRMDWGPTGARECSADLSIVVDVLSFSTSVTVAVERGMSVLPYPWRDSRAEDFARANDAVLAMERLEVAAREGAPPQSLSPAGLLRGRPVPRLILPSPNGSSISALLREQGSQVALGCLRNAAAVAAVAVRQLEAGGSVALIAAGERWSSDDSLRPALEDHLGAGAIAYGIREFGHDQVMGPEALAAAAVFETARPRLEETLQACVGGRELADRGYGEDVVVAAALDASPVVPVLRDGVFVCG